MTTERTWFVCPEGHITDLAHLCSWSQSVVHERKNMQFQSELCENILPVRLLNSKDMNIELLMAAMLPSCTLSFKDMKRNTEIQVNLTAYFHVSSHSSSLTF